MNKHQRPKEMGNLQHQYPENINEPFIVPVKGQVGEHSVELMIAIAQSLGFSRIRFDVPEHLHVNFLKKRDKVIRSMGLSLPLFFHQKDLGVYWHHVMLWKYEEK